MQITRITPNSRSDFRHDVSLRVLAVFVAGALVISLIYFLVGILRPPGFDARERTRSGIRLPLTIETPTEPAAREALGLVIYRCDQSGRVTYTDRPCSGGASRLLQLPPT